MKVSIKEVLGNWDLGYALDKHVLSSTYIGDNQYGHAEFDTKRSEVGESLYQLKYKGDWNQIEPLAGELARSVYPCFNQVGLLVPMPASNVRSKQPVTELTREFGKIVGIPVFDDILLKKANGPQLKDVKTKDEKLEVLKDCFIINDKIEGMGSRNALLVDDLFDTGASLEMACAALRKYSKIKNVYVATLTWK